jgi:hypothetical protein
MVVLLMEVGLSQYSRLVSMWARSHSTKRPKTIDTLRDTILIKINLYLRQGLDELFNQKLSKKY